MESYGIPPKPVEMVKVVNYGYQWALKPRLIFKSNLLSVLLYGCKTWRMSKADEKKLDVFLHKSRILKIYWLILVTNEEIRTKAEIEPISKQVARKK